ncbi:putative phospholipid-transporting ATPase 7 [Gracilariopsis chorda]|uniref:Phospholipid-transporting ATPase n=1 Tax=Gracilariopsis chorda TaxID=448386 RepID=A0A2V3IN66_9FLOR|nr:putative phospholipid-transporting ATPase 7 [Gracilariopsis chorda]|eukprot:PXF43518.1 putative phospholipid-transporting ATPase 7 [Gracilariopsis chorda]
MSNRDRPREKRRVGFRLNPAEESPQPPDTSFMMLRDDEAERLAGRVQQDATNNHESTNDTDQHQTSFLPKLSARELAGMADKSIQRAQMLGGRAVTRAAGLARVGRLPSLAAITAFGGKRAPVEDDASHRDEDDDDASPGRRLSTLSAAGLHALRRRAPEPDLRTVRINDESANSHFPSNYVSTTKYSLWSALPLFLYEQFTRFSNAYFLMVGIGYTINAITPIFTVGRYSTLWVLAVVVSISGVKEGLEDYHRYKEDRRVNRAITHVVGSSREEDQWATVRVGDILKVYESEHLPADIVLVASSSDDGIAYIETKQLDGESNLKVKAVPQAISKSFVSESSALLVRGRIECEAPNDRLYKFNGRMFLEKNGVPTDPSEPIPLGPENIMIRGSSLRNTDWVMGIVVNTGRDTKLMQNMKPRPRKNSRLERETNKHYFLTLLLQICVVVALTIQNSRICQELFDDDTPRAWYLFEKDGCSPKDSFLRFFTFFLTFAALIPISLYVSMEIVRGFQVYFIERDRHIIDPENGVKTEVRTSNLNEELGIVQHLFTDKTGTLTANRMEFKKCSIAGRVYEMADKPNDGATSMRELKEALQAGPESSAVRHFSVPELEGASITMRLLAICHSVVAEYVNPSDDASEHNTDVSEGSSGIRQRMLRRRRNKNGGRVATDLGTQNDPSRESAASMLTIQSKQTGSGYEDAQREASSLGDSAAGGALLNYQASSPDEAALVQAARAQGFTFLSRSNKDLVVEVFGKQETYQLLEVIEFDSTRKRMSVITRDPDGQVRIFTKGADAIIFDRLAPGQQEAYESTELHLHEFAVEGLRTLCLAYADLDDDWFDEWRHRYRVAASELTNRDEAMAKVADEVETNLTLIGATAIEDKLQDGVPDTLQKLEQAGIKIWVLTGDKQETAINIGLSCGAIDEGMDVVIVNEDNLEDTAAQLDRALGRWGAMVQSDRSMEKKFGIVIDGQTLHYALEEGLQKKLMVVTRMARSVIACRVSPKQKTEIVELVRKNEPQQVTLAIGDGANDVGMIQAAHVGVGIVGLEGQEAKLASDYSISQFRFLGRLMLVHGRWNYKRLVKLVLYTIYKNACLTLCEIYWATQSAYSGQPLLDPWMGGLYSVALTSLPPIVLGIFDQELTAEYALTFPEIYSKGQRSTAYNYRVFISWLSAALWQSAVIFFICFWGFGDIPSSNGQMFGMWPFGTVVFSAVIVNVHITLLVYQSSWTKLTAFLYVVSFLSWFLLGSLFSWRPIALTGALSPPLYAVTHRIFADARFWLVIMLCPVVTATPTLLWKYSKRRRRPNLKMIVQRMLRSGLTREEITGEAQRPLHRAPSYDPKRPATPSGPVTFVFKGEREYQFSGFNFDAGETGAVLRHTFHSPRGVRRRHMQRLKRSGSDPDLDVRGLGESRPRDQRDIRGDMTSVWVQGHAATNFGDREERGGVADGQDSNAPLFLASDFAEVDVQQRGQHRRAISDGAVLVEDRYQRLGEADEAGAGGYGGGGYGANLSSDDNDDDVERAR